MVDRCRVGAPLGAMVWEWGTSDLFINTFLAPPCDNFAMNPPGLAFLAAWRESLHQANSRLESRSHYHFS